MRHLQGTDAYLNRVIGCLESIHQHPTDGIFWKVVVGKAMLGTEQDEAFAVSPVNLQMVARQLRPEALAKYVEEGRSDPGKDCWFLRVLDYYEETAKLETEEEKAARKAQEDLIQQTEERLMQEAVDAQA